MKLSKRILADALCGVGKYLLALAIVFSIISAQNGIELKQHICAESGHDHIDLNLFVGISALNLCFDDEDDCCTGHEEKEDNCEDCCTDIDFLTNIDITTLTKDNDQHVAFPQTLSLLATFTTIHSSDTINTDEKVSYPYPLVKNAAQTHSRLCALLCTMLC